MQILLTSRPLSSKPISLINWLTQVKTQSPFDHVAIEHEGIVYESVVKVGVHKLLFKDWVVGREGTYLFKYEVPATEIDLSVFDKYNNSGYDIKANLIYFFIPKKWKKKLLSKKWENDFFCSEITAIAMRLKDPSFYTPKDIALLCDDCGYPLNIDVIK